MFDLARELFVCACATDIPDGDAPDASALRFRFGGADDLGRLEDHDAPTLATMQAHLLRGDRWLLGERDGLIVTYTFLSLAQKFQYPGLPGCTFSLRADVAYGHGAWTPPSLRGRGYRRRAFVEELRWLRTNDKKWEASVFIAPQLDPARRSLATAGIVVEPLWHVEYGRDRRLSLERLVPAGDDRCVPITSYNA
jgi:hypothetical protein